MPRSKTPPTRTAPHVDTRTSAHVAEEITALDDIARPRAAMLADMEGERPALIDAGDIEAIEALDTKIRRARIEGEVDAARRAKLVAEHDSLTSAENYAADQADRRAEYAEAVEAAEEARRLFHEEYPRLAREIAALLTCTMGIRTQVQAANARLPDGEPRIPTDFEPSRGRPQVLPTKMPYKRHYWVSKITGEEAPHRPADDPNYERRTRDEEMTSQGAPAIAHVAIHDLVALPGVAYGDPAFWTPHPGYLNSPNGTAFSDFRQVAQGPANPPLGGQPRPPGFLGGRI